MTHVVQIEGQTHKRKQQITYLMFGKTAISRDSKKTKRTKRYKRQEVVEGHDRLRPERTRQMVSL